jgi:hypothetical protein
VDNHPHISDFIPRKHRTIALLVSAGLVTTAVVAALDQFVAPLVASAATTNVSPLSIAGGSSLAAWIGSVVLFIGSLSCALIYSIRKHRIDDYRGRYRIWRWAVVACLFASLNCVAGMHSLLADVLAHYSGWTALRAGAIWWLVLAGFPLAWIALRTMLDMSECRLAATLLLAAAISYATSIVCFLGWLPGVEPAMEAIVTGGTALLGHWMLLACFISYARHVVLDAQGLVAVRKPTQHASRAASPRQNGERRKDSPDVEPRRKSPAAILRMPDSSPAVAKPAIIPVKSQASPSEWVDGSRRERDRYEADDGGDEERNSGGQKLSKAERKQLRKLKARNRAA